MNPNHEQDPIEADHEPAPGPFQRLDGSQTYPYTLNVYLVRILWDLVYLFLFRFSPLRAYGWRRRVLNLFGAKIHKTALVRRSVRVRHPWLLEMGAYSCIGDNSEVYNLGPVRMGDHSLISQNVYVCAGTHDYRESHLPLVRAPITIGHGVWVCAGAFLGPGVSVADNAIVGARAVVTRDVPEGEIHAGNPAAFVKRREPAERDSDEPRVRRPIRITIITGPFNPLPPAPCGAVEFRWRGKAEQMAAMGHHVTMFSRAWEGYPVGEIVRGVQHVRLTSFKRSQWLWLSLVKDMVYSLRMTVAIPKSDIVVCNAFFLPMVLSILRPGVGKVVYNAARFPKGQMWMYRRVDRISAVSSAVSKAIHEQCPSVDPIVRVVSNPVNVKAFVPPPEGTRYNGDERSIVYTGRVHPEKGLHLLFEAFARIHDKHPGARLRIVGPTAIPQGGGGDRYINELKSLVKGLPIEFVPPTYNQVELAKILQEADFYCYPSIADYGESFGVAPLEAMATGLPIVVSGLECFQDFIDDGETGLVFDHRAPDAVDRLVAQLDRVLSDEPAARAMGEAAAKRALEFSLSHIARRYLRDWATMLTVDPEDLIPQEPLEQEPLEPGDPATSSDSDRAHATPSID